MSRHEFDRLAAFAEQQLDAAEQAQVQRHLEGCAECHAALAEVRRGIALANELEAGDMPAAVAASVRARVVPRRRSRSLIAVAASLALIAGAGAFWQVNRPWAVMRATVAPPTPFELDGRALHARIAQGERLAYAARDDRDAWNWLASQGAPIAGLLPSHSPQERARYQVTGAAVREVGGTLASVVSYQIDNRPVTLVLAHRRNVANAPSAGLLSKTVTHRRDANGANVLTWSVGGGTYVMVSELEDYGQRACFVCHTTPRFQAAIRSLQPR